MWIQKGCWGTTAEAEKAETFSINPKLHKPFGCWHVRVPSLSKGQNHCSPQPAATQKVTVQETSALLMHSGGEGRGPSSAEAGLVPASWVFAHLLVSKLKLRIWLFMQTRSAVVLAGSVPHPYGSFPCLLRKGCEKNNIHKLSWLSDVPFSKWEAVRTNSDLLALLCPAMILNTVVCWVHWRGAGLVLLLALCHFLFQAVRQRMPQKQK